MIRVGIHYDGNFLFHVSNYYLHHHGRRARISVGGLHEFVLNRVAALEGADRAVCRIVEARYFRGRLRAAEAGERDVLYKERVFDDVLTRAGVQPHYLHASSGAEKGVEVLLALEALESALCGRVDVVALMVADGDYAPLVRKLHAHGVRVLLMAWDLRYTDHAGAERETRTAQALLDEATYPVPMHEIIDDPAQASVAQGLFVPRREASPLADGAATGGGPTGARAGFRPPSQAPAAPPPPTGPLSYGTIDAIRNGYGFIHPDDGGPNLFFLYQEVLGMAFADLQEGDPVAFIAGVNERGPCARAVRKAESDRDADDGRHDHDHDDEDSDDGDHDDDDERFGRGLLRDDGPPDPLSEVRRHGHDDDDEDDINGNR